VSELIRELLDRYLLLGGGVILGCILGRLLPVAVAAFLGQFLFWIGVPLSIVAFLRVTELSGAIWLAPVMSWLAIFSGAGLAWIWLRWPFSPQQRKGDRPFQGAFLLSAMVGNTGYLGYPIIFSLVEERFFGWALFYDLLGTVLGSYGLGVLLAAYFGQKSLSVKQILFAVVQNPTLWALGFGLWFRQVPLPPEIDEALEAIAWTVVSLALVLIGMRLSRLQSWQSLRPAGISLSIKMLLVPLVLGGLLVGFGVSGSPLLVMVLQMAMPPAFATVVIAEAYDLDRELAVTAVAAGSTSLLVTLPVWLLLFG